MNKLMELAVLEASMLSGAIGASGGLPYEPGLLGSKLGPTKHYGARPQNNNVEYYLEDKGNLRRRKK